MSQFEVTLSNNCRILNRVLYHVGCLHKPSGGYHYNMTLLYIAVGLNIRNCLLAVYSIQHDFSDNLDQMVFAMIPLIAASLAAFKLINVIKYRNEVAYLMKTIEDNFWGANSKSSPEEQDIIKQYSRYVHVCTLLQIGIFVGGCSLWILKPLIDMLIMYTTHSDEPFKRVLPLHSLWPFNLDPYASPLYEIEYILQAIACYYTCFGLAATSSIFVHLVLNTCGQFKLVQVRLKYFDKIETDSEAIIDEQENVLHSCIKLHQDILIFSSKMETVLTMALFWECFLLTAFLCMSGFIATMFSENLYVLGFCGMCVAGGLFDIFFHCLPPTILTTLAFNVSFAAYESNWYNAPVSIQKQIMFIIGRSQKPVFLTAGKLTPVSVETFEAITRTSASYFTFLISMQDAKS